MVVLSPFRNYWLRITKSKPKITNFFHHQFSTSLSSVNKCEKVTNITFLKSSNVRLKGLFFRFLNKATGTSTVPYNFFMFVTPKSLHRYQFERFDKTRICWYFEMKGTGTVPVPYLNCFSENHCTYSSFVRNDINVKKYQRTIFYLWIDIVPHIQFCTYIYVCTYILLNISSCTEQTE